jgi:hypothetical protein
MCTLQPGKRERGKKMHWTERVREGREQRRLSLRIRWYSGEGSLTEGRERGP